MKGMIFSSESIPGILSGLKTQTRRTEKSLTEINKEPDKWGLDPVSLSSFGMVSFGFRNSSSTKTPFEGYEAVVPRYNIGEALYVKEAYFDVPYPPYETKYKANFGEDSAIWIDGKTRGWKSPLFMPRAAARLFIRITNVRVERLHEISKPEKVNDLLAELGRKTYVDSGSEHPQRAWDDYHETEMLFQERWNSINKKNNWEANPWVFVYDFERVKR